MTKPVPNLKIYIPYLSEYKSHIETWFDLSFHRVRLKLRIFHKPNKLVGVVKCTDCVVVKWRVMTKRMSYTVSFKLKAVELTEASNRKM